MNISSDGVQTPVGCWGWWGYADFTRGGAGAAPQGSLVVTTGTSYTVVVGQGGYITFGTGVLRLYTAEEAVVTNTARLAVAARP